MRVNCKGPANALQSLFYPLATSLNCPCNAPSEALFSKSYFIFPKSNFTIH